MTTIPDEFRRCGVVAPERPGGGRVETRLTPDEEVRHGNDRARTGSVVTHRVRDQSRGVVMPCEVIPNHVVLEPADFRRRSRCGGRDLRHLSLSLRTFT